MHARHANIIRMDQTTPPSPPDPTKPVLLPPQARQALVQGRLQAVVYGALLAVIIGWVLYIGRPVFVPMVFGIIVAYIIIGLSRAIGETMIVAVAAGAGPKFTLNPFQGAETITGHIVRISGGDLSYDSIDYNSIFALGLLLFLITLTLNIISQRIVRRYREVYE